MARNFSICFFLLVLGVLLFGQSTSTEGRILVNAEGGKWELEKNGSESITLREDAQTGATELLVHYSAGHVFTPHWHDANERIILIEGQLALDGDGGKKSLVAGGYAFLPAQQVQRLSCVSSTRCSFYVSWDGAPKSHSVDK
jgi:hypothetical protein